MAYEVTGWSDGVTLYVEKHVDQGLWNKNSKSDWFLRK